MFPFSTPICAVFLVIGPPFAICSFFFTISHSLLFPLPLFQVNCTPRSRIAILFFFAPPPYPPKGLLFSSLPAFVYSPYLTPTDLVAQIVLLFYGKPPPQLIIFFFFFLCGPMSFRIVNCRSFLVFSSFLSVAFGAYYPHSLFYIFLSPSDLMFFFSKPNILPFLFGCLLFVVSP